MPEPKFNLSCVSRKWSKDWLLVNTSIQRNQMLLSSSISDEATPAQRATLQSAQLEAFDRMPELIAQQERLLADVLVSVPREWLVPDAPQNLDWSNPESLNWLQEIYYSDLLTALTNERSGVRENSKN